MTLSETVKNLKLNEAFSQAVVDVNERRRMVAVAWFDGPENAEAVEILLNLGFEKIRDYYSKVWPAEEKTAPTSIEEIKAGCQPPRGLSFEEWIING